MRNFAQLWCQSTCSPIQSTFMKVQQILNSTQTDLPYVNNVDYLITTDYANQLYNSCKSVLNPNTNEPALSMLCGKEASQCTPEDWLQFMGSTQLNPLAPFQINFIQYNKSEVVYEGDTYFPNNATMVPCQSYTPESDLPCSCQDCRASCTPVPPYPELNEGKFLSV